MAKKLICLLLCLLMVLAVLTSCSNEGDAIDNTIDDASRYTTTLNFWLITESAEIAKVSELMYGGFNAEVDYAHFDELTEDDQTKHAAEKAVYDTLSATEKEAVAQLGAINKAINKITKDNLKTQIKFRYLLEQDYYTALEKAFADREAAKKAGTLQKPEVSADETVLNEYGIPELKYPTTPDYQVDILYLDGADRYREYANKELVTALDNMLEDSAMQLSYFVNNTLLDSVKYYGVTYAVPNNHTIGEYVYLAVDTALASSYNYLPEAFSSSLYSQATYDFLNLVYESGNEDVYPLYCDDGVELEKLHYWNFALNGDSFTLDPDTFSLFGGFYGDTTAQGDRITMGNLLDNDVYRSNLEKKVYYETTENFLAPDAEAKAAMRVVKGGWEMRAELEAEGYSVLTIEVPRATDEDVYGSMFAIGANTSDSSRAMEIVTYMNTDARIRNLLQYGVEGTNYTLETDAETGKVWAKETSANVYKMDINKTGNLFIAHPNSAEAIKEWEFGKEQNRYVNAYPTVGLFFNMENRALDKATIETLNLVSAQYKAKVLDQLNSKEALEAFKAELSAFNRKNTSEMAAYLLSKVGYDLTYTLDGNVHAITQKSLTAALTLMVDETIPEDPKEGEITVMAPGALYRDWRETSGVLDN